MEALLVAARFLHHGLALVLFGSALFPLYARSNWRAPLLWLSLAAAASSLLWLWLTVAGMAGGPAKATPATIFMVVQGMGFGKAWIVRFLLLLAAVMAILAPESKARSVLIPVIAGLYLGGIALTGHTQVTGGLLVLIDAVHLLAAGTWLGGLVGLAATLREAGSEIGPVLKRFSRLNYWAVGFLVGSGLANSLVLVASLDALFSTPYGRLLLGKLALFAAMAVIALTNRFWISPRLYEPRTGAEAAPWLARLRRNIMLEQALGALVIAAVAWLGTLDPPGA